MNDRHSMNRWAVRGGVNRVVAILLALIAVMVVLIAIPAWNDLSHLSQEMACEQALKSAGDGLIIEYLSRFEEDSVDAVMATLDEVMPARPKICPSGGEVYLVKNSQGIYEPLCGLHNPDLRQRVRLNASRALELLMEELRVQRRDTKSEPEAVEIELNSLPLLCQRVQQAPNLRRGTSTTSGYEGVVAFYGIAGDGDFNPEGATAGDICYFVYADENYCAIWRFNDGWTGDAYAV